MTLALTEVSGWGIAMAADSAITLANRQTGSAHVSPRRAEKLQVVPHIEAGLAAWGSGTIDGVETDRWMRQFIGNQSSTASLSEFASSLADELNARLGPNADPSRSRLGFHLAGYEECDGKKAPSFYHIHDGHSEALASRGISVDPTCFNANNDVPPENIGSGSFFITRNGDFRIYAALFARIEQFFDQLKSVGVAIPNSVNLNDRADYLAFQIRTIAELYRMSNLVPGIGGPTACNAPPR